MFRRLLSTSNDWIVTILRLIMGVIFFAHAFGIACNMLVAVLMVHVQNGLFMNWSGQQKGEGFEFHLLALAIPLVLIVRGSGPLSVDHALSGKSEARTSLRQTAQS
jgi:putative oxidoreductase